MTNNATKLEAAGALMTLRPFMSNSQRVVFDLNSRGEESQWFFNKAVEMAERVETMAKTYEQDGKGDEALAYLHYFRGGCDWYITEKDMEAEQLQAYGWADLGHGGELGYISIVELVRHGIELDLHFTPTTLGQIRGKRAAA